MMDILYSRNRYIVPFLFENEGKTFNDLVREIEALGPWRIQQLAGEKVERDVYELIQGCFVMNEELNNIGCSFYYKTEEKTPLLEFTYTHAKKEFDVAVTQAGMFLFRTNIGLFWYEVQIPQQAALEDLILFQNEFKELAYKRYVKLGEREQRYTFEKKSDPSAFVFMGHWIHVDMLGKLPCKCDYFAHRKNPLDEKMEIPDKAILFNYIVFGQMEHGKFVDSIYYLNNGYNHRYKHKENIEEEFMEPFRSTYYYTTSGGCGYYVMPEADNKNFYLKTLKWKIMKDYFLLYILALYQNYSILKFSKDMGKKLSAECDCYLTDTQGTLNVLKEMETKINVFLIKSIYSSVSHISHQNDFYQYIIKRLCIWENIEGLTVGLESLHKLQEKRERERIEELRSLERLEKEYSDGKLSMALTAISILAFISAFKDGFETAKVLGEIFAITAEAVTIIGSVVMILAVMIEIAAITSFISSIRGMKAVKRELEERKKKKAEQ